MTAAPAIRPARDADFPEIAHITNHYIRTSAIHFATDPVSGDELRASWEKTRSRYPFLVAEAGGEVLGYAKAGVWRERAAYAWTPEAGIYVRSDSHRQGLGRLLYERLFEIMADQGFHSVVAGITLPNEPSVRLHESLGFLPAGVIRQAGWKFDQWWDVGFWQRPLGDATQIPTRIRPVTFET